MALTADSVAKRLPTDKRQEVPDGGNGLYLIVQPSGVKSWAVRYRSPDGERRKVTLGPVLNKRTEKLDVLPSIGAAHTLAEARKAATALMAKVAEGIDPAKARAEARRPRPDRSMAAMIERFLTANEKKRSIYEMRRRLEKHVVPALGDRAVEGVTRADVGAMAWERIGGQVEANRTFETLRLFFRWAIGRGIIDVSPMVGLVKPFPDAEQERSRFLSDVELAAVWRAAGDIGSPFGPLVRLLILTGQRRGEVAGMNDAELDMAACLWSLPVDRTKNKMPHTVPLSAAAISELDNVTRLSGSTLFFTSTGTTPVSGWGRVKDRLDRAVGFNDWTIHDLRRTVATGLQRLRIPLQVTEAVLNHISGSRDGIVGIYQRHDYADEKREALMLWSRHIAWIALPVRSNDDETDDSNSDQWSAQAAFNHIARTSQKRTAKQLNEQHDTALRGSDDTWLQHLNKWRRLARLIDRQLQYGHFR